MAKTGQRERPDQLRAELLKQAYTKASGVLAAQTELSPARAREVAPAAVDAATPSIRADHIRELVGMPRRTAIVIGCVSVGVLALDTLVLALVAVRGPRWSRPAAALAVTGHVAAYAYTHRMHARVRAAARQRMTNGNRHGVA